MADEPTVSKEQLAMMDDLDYVPELDEGTTVEPEVEATEPEVEGKEPEAKPEVKPEPEPEPKKEEKKPTEVELLDTYKEQVKHFQKLYEDERKAKTEADERAKREKPPEQAAKSPVPTQEQIRTHYAPEVQKTVAAGYMSEEFANSFPEEAVQFMYHRDIIYNLVKRVSELVAMSNQQTSTNQSSQMDGTLNTLFDSAAKKGGFYESLAQPEVREKFKAYLLELNPFVDQIKDEFIDRQWLAYNKEAILEAAKIAAGGASSPSNKGDAKGEGGGNRPGKPKASQEVRPWDDL